MLLAKVLARILGEGRLTIIDATGRSHNLTGANPGPAVTMRIHTWWTGIRLVLRPRLAFGAERVNDFAPLEVMRLVSNRAAARA